MADGREHEHGDSAGLVAGGTGEARTGSGPGEGPADGPPGRRWARRRVVRWAAVALAALVLLAAGAGTYLYVRLDGNLRSLPLFGGVSGDAGTERADAFGRTPLNVLVIGSDTRADRADCRLGGDCGPGQNADVVMVLHIAADRSQATVLSIPRDTVTQLPACRKPKGGVVPARRGPVNATLQYGPGCTVAAVHAFTGVPGDHFVLADFSGVVRMTGAVGGVPVCVDRDLYDPYAQLKLARGRHVLKGRAALAFLRSRHAFGDGSDLGRTGAQHLYLAALFRRLRGSASLGDPAGLLSLADAATRSLTVDPGLAAVPRLAGLAGDVRKVPAARFAFTTMPSAPDPVNRNRLVVTAAGRRLFTAIAADRPPAAGGAASPGPPVSPGPIGSTSGKPRPSASAGARSADETFDDGAAGPDAGGRTAANAGACAKVATRRTVRVGGRAMTPSAAFAATPRIAVSAR